MSYLTPLLSIIVVALVVTAAVLKFFAARRRLAEIEAVAAQLRDIASAVSVLRDRLEERPLRRPEIRVVDDLAAHLEEIRARAAAQRVSRDVERWFPIEPALPLPKAGKLGILAARDPFAMTAVAPLGRWAVIEEGAELAGDAGSDPWPLAALGRHAH